MVGERIVATSGYVVLTSSDQGRLEGRVSFPLHPSWVRLCYTFEHIRTYCVAAQCKNLCTQYIIIGCA